MRLVKMKLICLLLLLIPLSANAAVIIDENFDDKTFSTNISIYSSAGYCTGAECPYAVGRGGTGFAIAGDHANNQYDTLGIYNGASANLTTGVYYNYWVKYDSGYEWPTGFNNIKIFKLSGGVGEGDVEIIWNTTAPTQIRYQYEDELSSTAVGYPSVSGVSLGTWFEIEIYIKIPATGSDNAVLHLAINGIDVIDLTGISLWKHSQGAYSGTAQFVSVRASNTVPSLATTNGNWWWDDLYIETTATDPIISQEPNTQHLSAGQTIISAGETQLW